MEKKLLLLGFLRNHDMHGYQLSEMLAERAANSVTLSKANAYKLLKQMEAEGWVTYREEREGNWPTRRVYSVTPAGEAAFQDLLRRALADYERAEFPHLVPLNFIGDLPPADALALLRQRRQRVAALREALRQVPEEMRRAHLSVDYLIRFFDFELAWLDGVLADLETA
jgi:DNA-binding PadR family transcriptional regulator